jgi:hypothetical protein
LETAALGVASCVTLGQSVTLSVLSQLTHVTKSLDGMIYFHQVAAVELSCQEAPPVLMRTLGPGKGRAGALGTSLTFKLPQQPQPSLGCGGSPGLALLLLLIFIFLLLPLPLATWADRCSNF